MVLILHYICSDLELHINNILYFSDLELHKYIQI